MKFRSKHLLVILAAFTPALFAADEHGHDKDHGAASPATQGHPPAEPGKAGHAHDEHAEGHSDEVKLTPEAVQRNGITIEQAKLQKLSDSLVVPARLDFNRERMAHVGAAVRGRVVEINARVGDKVHKGDELLVMESPELGEAQSDYLQRRAAVRASEAAIEPLKVSYERGKALHEKSEGLALAEVQKREADYKAAVGGVETAKAASAAAENRLHLMGMQQSAVEALAKTAEIQPRYSVRAPIDGQVIQREVALGELVLPEKEALLILANMDELWVLADVPEAKLGVIRAGAAVGIAFTARPQGRLVGKIAMIAATVDPTTHTARVRIEVPNDGGVLRPGMFAQVDISISSEADKAAVAVPDEAVQMVEGKPAVFVPVEGEANTFAKREVEVGEAIGGLVPILGGLKEGEAYVSAGSFILKAELAKGSAAHVH